MSSNRKQKRTKKIMPPGKSQDVLCLFCCRLSTYRHRFARAAPAPRAKRKIQRIVDVRRPSTFLLLDPPAYVSRCRGDTRPARGLKLIRFSPSPSEERRTVNGYHPSSLTLRPLWGARLAIRQWPWARQLVVMCNCKWYSKCK